MDRRLSWLAIPALAGCRTLADTVPIREHIGHAAEAAAASPINALGFTGVLAVAAGLVLMFFTQGRRGWLLIAVGAAITVGQYMLIRLFENLLWLFAVCGGALAVTLTALAIRSALRNNSFQVPRPFPFNGGQPPWKTPPE